MDKLPYNLVEAGAQIFYGTLHNTYFVLPFTVVFGFIFHVQFQFFQLDNFLLHRNNRFCNAAAIEGYDDCRHNRCNYHCYKEGGEKVVELPVIYGCRGGNDNISNIAGYSCKVTLHSVIVHGDC